MRLLAAAVLLVVAGCGTPAAQREQLPRTTASFCAHVAGVVKVTGRLYGQSKVSESDVSDLGHLARDIAGDATDFDSIPAVDTDITSLAPAARDLRDAIVAAVELMRQGASIPEATEATGEVLDAVVAIPRDGCQAELQAPATERAINHAAATVRCYAAVRFITAAERFGDASTAKSRTAVEQSSAAFALAARLLRRTGKAARMLDELATTLSSWLDANRFVLRELPGADDVLDTLTQQQMCE